MVELREEYLQKTVRDLRDGESCFTNVKALLVGEDNQCYLDLSYDISMNGWVGLKDSLAVRCVDKDTYVVNIFLTNNYQWRKTYIDPFIHNVVPVKEIRYV